MDKKARTTVIVGNWKMNKTAAEAVDFIHQLAPHVKGSFADGSPLSICLAVPFTAIKPASDAAKDTHIVIGAQNMNDASDGAFTGEIAGRMLKDAGACFVILGHSERRQIFGESDEWINRKVRRALEELLQPILCIGETLEEYEAGKTEEVLEKQLKGCLQGVDNRQMENIVIAYEPVWAIGTGRTATPELVQQVHQFCRKVVASLSTEAIASGMTLIYGGSVKPSNAKDLMGQRDIDGLLVGGASLTVQSFSEIINYK